MCDAPKLTFRDDPISITSAALESYSQTVLLREPGSQSGIEMAEAIIREILGRIRLVNLPRQSIRLSKVRLIIFGDQVVFAGSTWHSIPFYNPYREAVY